ncbi:hypothetical protein DSBG_2357 [Desulfosporosinus sp. BG]|nr:hypothetical protein DSBG_2357 [Desulfosporosinus sp. BG]
MVIGFEMYKPRQDAVEKDEGELSVGKRLISIYFLIIHEKFTTFS